MTYRSNPPLHTPPLHRSGIPYLPLRFCTLSPATHFYPVPATFNGAKCLYHYEWKTEWLVGWGNWGTTRTSEFTTRCSRLQDIVLYLTYWEILLRFLCMKCIKWTHSGQRVTVRLHVSSPTLLNELWLNFMFGSKSCQSNLVSIHIS